MRSFDNCLNCFDCWYNLDHDTKQKCLRITDLVIILISTFLWILFVILFATKHESSSSFILTGTSNLSSYAVKTEINTRLSKKYHVNDLKVSANGNQFTAVFSLRDNQKTNDVNKYISYISSDVLEDVVFSDGSSPSLTCIPPSYLPPTTTTVSTIASSSSSSSTTNSPSQPPTSTKSPPVQTNFYCADPNLQRDIVIIVDFLSVEDDRNSALQILQSKLNASTSFGPTRIFLMGTDSSGPVNVSTDFASTSEDFNKDWNYMMTLNMDNGMYNIPTDALFSRVAALPFRPNVPRAIFMLVSHSIQPVALPQNQLANRGYFVAISRATLYKILGIENVVSTGLMIFDDWASMAIADPFSSFVCQFVWTNNTISPPPAPAEDFFLAPSVDNSCEKLDIIFIFDSSNPPTFVDDWKQFSVNFVSRFALTSALDGDNIQAGIIQFAGNATLIAELGNTSLEAFNQTVYSKVQNNLEGGQFLGGAFQLATNQFNSFGEKNHGKLIILMTSRSPADLTTSTQMGEILTAQGIDIFIVGTGIISANSYKDLIKINGNPDWFFNSTVEAISSLPGIVLNLFPCPSTACFISYFAIEATDKSPTIQALNYSQQIISQVNLVNNGTKYRIMLYNSDQYFLPISGAVNFDQIQAILSNFLTNQSTLDRYLQSFVTLDDAVNSLADDLNKQSLRNNGLFQSSVLFFGNANYYPLISGHNFTYQANLNDSLAAAGTNLKSQTPNIFLADNSMNSNLAGPDLWPFIVDSNQTFPFDNSIYSNLNGSNYYSALSKMSCTPPNMTRCDFNFVDIAIVLDIVGDPTPIQNYVNSLVSQFSISYTAHFSMLTMGLGSNAVLLTNLQSYSSSQEFVRQSFSAYDSWRASVLATTSARRTTTSIPNTSISTTAENTSISATAANTTISSTISTPAAATNFTTTQAPRSSSARSNGPTTSAVTLPDRISKKTIPPITLRIDTAGPKEFEAADLSSQFPMTSAIIQSMFTKLKTQFGCNYTSGDNGDRVMAPNIVLLISDNFESYSDEIISQFSPAIQTNWQCDDCPGKPLFYFGGYTTPPPVHGLGQFTIQPVDTAPNVTQIPKAIFDINNVVATVCQTNLPECPNYAPQLICSAPSFFQ